MAKKPKFLENKYPNPALFGVKKEDFKQNTEDIKQEVEAPLPIVDNKPDIKLEAEKPINKQVKKPRKKKEPIKHNFTIDEDIKLYSTDEVAAILNITQRTVYNYIKSNQLKSFKIGKLHRIRKSDLNDFYKTQAGVYE